MKPYPNDSKFSNSQLQVFNFKILIITSLFFFLKFKKKHKIKNILMRTHPRSGDNVRARTTTNKHNFSIGHISNPVIRLRK